MSSAAPSGAPPQQPPVAATGIAGLDAILHGGLPRDEMHVVQGITGTGKTTIALQFLAEGVRTGETTLYVTLSQSKLHLERIARSHGWNIDGMVIYELSPGTVASRIAARQTILPTADVELGELFRELSEVVGRVRPRRAVVDSITVLQLLAGSPQRYHREVVTLRQLFVEQGCTLMSLADHPAANDQGAAPEMIFHPLSGCVIDLSQEARPYGDARRRLRIAKARGIRSNSGYHDFQIRTGRTDVYPRLGAYELEESAAYESVKSDVEVLDRLLGGGVDTGTTCLIVGASGVGKSTIATLFADAVARAGNRAAVYLFDERPETWLTRSEGLGLGVRAHCDAGRLQVRQLDPGQIAPGELAQDVRRQVEQEGTRAVVIDSIVGYFAAMGLADVLMTQLHELLTYLTRRGVLLLLCGSQEGFMSIGSQQVVDVSYLSDTILALTYFEEAGELRRAIAVVKKKQGPHGATIHELVLAAGKIDVLEPALAKFGNLLVPGNPGRSGT